LDVILPLDDLNAKPDDNDIRSAVLGNRASLDVLSLCIKLKCIDLAVGETG